MAKGYRPYPFFAAGVFALAIAAAFLPPPEAANAQSAEAAVQTAGRANASGLAEGFYVVNDDFKFSIARRYGLTLMRFAGDDELFVLTTDRAPLGGRVLKYDTGDVALQVTAYGAVTIYTSTAPGGLPADRVGDAEAVTFPIPTLTIVKSQATEWAAKLKKTHGLNLSFSVDWSRIDDGSARYLALEMIRNTARALSGLCANRAHQQELATRLKVVRILRGEKPNAIYRSGVMTLTFAPILGLKGRMSSLAIARAIRIWL